MRFVVAPFVVAATLLTASIAPVRAQVDSREGIALQNQIYQLRQELKAAEDQMSRGGGSNIRPPAYAPAQQLPGGGNDLLAQLLTRVDALEDQVRQLRGRIDETQNQVQRQNDDLGKRIDDLAFQINPQGGSRPGPQAGGPPPGYSSQGPGSGYGQGPGSGYGQGPGPAYPSQGPAPSQLGPPPTQLGAPPAQPAAARPTGPRTPETALQDGNAALTRRDYLAAEAAAREVLTNRTSPRAYDARLLLAQALSGQRQYAQAAIAFDDAYNSSRKGTHAQDALLGLASSLTAINEKKAACDTLTRLRSDFPQPRPDVAANATATAQKAGCH
jgi:TolA-binding protein